MIMFPTIELQPFESLLKTTESAKSEESSASFSDLLQNAVETVKETEATVQEDQVLLATGEVDDPHTITINMAKADLALQTLVQVRNRAIDAYKEIMQMPL